jgi:NAD(P)-dependent dehydrogenase (short-subunit alcohol dehydrogenase family)
MKKCVGIWLDRAKATIVTVINEEVRLLEIQSEVDPKLRLAGGSRSKVVYGPQDVAPEGKQDRRRLQQLQRFYQRIIDAVGEVDHLLILGPGATKRELEKRIVAKMSKKLRSVSVRPADKMTQRQLIAEIKKFAQEIKL